MRALRHGQEKMRARGRGLGISESTLASRGLRGKVGDKIRPILAYQMAFRGYGENRGLIGIIPANPQTYFSTKQDLRGDIPMSV